MTQTQTFNRLQLKALLLDAITFVKFKQHLAPNWKSAKDRFCDMRGISRRTSTLNLICTIGEVYSENGLTEEFETLVKKSLGNLIARVEK